MPALEREASALERESASPDFWGEAERARAKMRRLAARQRTIDVWRGLERRVEEAGEFIELAAADDDAAMAAELEGEVRAIAAQLEEQAFELAFSGPYDERNAIVEIRPGAGGVESQDWAEMLERMYLRWAERSEFAVELVDRMEGDEAGIKSATLEVKGESAYGWLRSEHGVHRLVRISPFDQQHARHTSFAKVDVLPEVEKVDEIELDEDELKIDVYRASGNGGQNVQKNATAVRITHLPTNIVVSCQNERSLRRNQESAKRVLRSRLLQLELLRQEEERRKLLGEQVEAGWGNQIRSYVLQPYRMVKDLRSGYETSSTEDVLDGDIEPLLRAWLQTQIGVTDGEA